MSVCCPRCLPSLRSVIQECPKLLFVLYCLNSVTESFPLTAYGLWLNEEIKMPLDMQSQFYACIFLPWCLKPFYSWVSINYPIRGEHKRPYIILCSIGSAAMYIVTALFVQSYASAFVVTTLRAFFNAFEELLLSLILVDHATVAAGSSLDEISENETESAKRKRREEAVRTKIGVLQAASTGARNIGTLASLVVGLVVYQCGEYTGLSSRLIIGITSVFAVCSAICGFFLKEQIPTAGPDTTVSTQRRCCRRSATIAPEWEPTSCSDRCSARKKCKCTRKGSVAVALFVLLQLLVVVTILRTSVAEDNGSLSAGDPAPINATANSSMTTAPVTLPPAFPAEFVTALAVAFWTLVALLGVTLVSEIVYSSVLAAKRRRQSQQKASKDASHNQQAMALGLASQNGTIALLRPESEESLPSKTEEKKAFWQTPLFLVAASFIFVSNAMPTAVTQWDSFQYASFPKQPCEVQYLSIIGSVASVVASVIYGQWLIGRPTLPLILTLVSLSAAIGLTRLPVLSYVQDGPGKEALLSNGTDTAENVIQFSIFAAYGFVSSVSSELATVSMLVFATQMCPAPGKASKLKKSKDTRGIYYALFLSLLDIGDSVSDWITSPIVAALGITWTNFAALGYLVDLESAGALLALSFLPFLMALKRAKTRKDAERAALEDDAEAALEVGAQQTGIDASIN